MKIKGENYRAKDREERNRALKREGAQREINGCLSRESSAILCSLSSTAIERERGTLRMVSLFILKSRVRCVFLYFPPFSFSQNSDRKW